MREWSPLKVIYQPHQNHIKGLDTLLFDQFVRIHYYRKNNITLNNKQIQFIIK